MQNIYDDSWDATQDRPGFQWNRMRLGRRLGGKQLGASVYLLNPGQKSFPYHYHHSNEELLVVLEGSVTLRTPNGASTAVSGDAISFVVGPEGAHQVINDSDEPARILMLSTMISPDVTEYPDSGNVGVITGAGKARFLDGAADADYFKGE